MVPFEPWGESIREERAILSVPNQEDECCSRCSGYELFAETTSHTCLATSDVPLTVGRCDWSKDI